MPAAVRLSETAEWHVQPLQPLQILDAPRLENSVPDRLWDWWSEDPPQRWQVDQWRWNDRASSQTENQQIVIGINGAAGNPAMTADFPITTGIGGHPGPPELMMKGGLRGHHGHILHNMSRKSTSTRARLLSGTETSQRRSGEITVEC